MTPELYVPEQHFEQVRAWSRFRNEELTPEALPRMGFIIPGKAAGFLYCTDSSVAWIEGLVVAPELEPEARDTAFDAIVAAISQKAQALGFKLLVGCTAPEVVGSARRQGFQHLGGGFELIVLQLDDVQPKDQNPGQEVTPEPYVPEQHFEQVRAWLRFRDEEMTPEALPRTGFIIPGKVAGFLYRTDSSVAWIENLVAAPTLEREERNKLVDAIVTAISQKAKALGFKRLVGYTVLDVVVRRAKRHGFQHVGGGFELIALQLGDMRSE